MSPFVSKSTVQPQDLRKEAIMGTKRNDSQQTTPKKSMSPLKRFNKVAPSPVKPSSVPLMSAVQQSSLQSNSTSLLDEAKLEQETALEKKERPGSAPLNKMNRQERKEKKNVAKPITLEPVIVVQSKNGDLVVKEWEHQYNEGNV